jgi:hypothetical protein
VTSRYDCEGCGIRVFVFGRDTVPAHGFCAICAWLCEFVPDPIEMMAMRRHIGECGPAAGGSSEVDRRS